MLRMLDLLKTQRLHLLLLDITYMFDEYVYARGLQISDLYNYNQCRHDNKHMSNHIAVQIYV